MIRRMLVTCVAGSWILCFPFDARSQITPSEAASIMGRGINLGNTFEPPFEGAWNNGPAQEAYFDAYVEAGFKSVRIPVRWDGHTGQSAPFAVTSSWMNRVEEVVDWALNRNLMVVINGHHEDWLKQGYSDATLRARYDSIWEQIAIRFKVKSDRLLFEIINEPNGLTVAEINDLNARILGIIRETNPTRIVIYSGNEYSGIEQLMAASIPNDPYIMAYFHSYDPWNFAGLANGVWGSPQDRTTLHNHLGTVANWAASNGVAITDSEFGVVRSADYNSRMRYYNAYVEELQGYQIPFQVWDDGGDFGVLIRGQGAWRETKDILIHTYPDGPGSFDITTEDAAIVLTWVNREIHQKILIERAVGDGVWIQIDEVAASATSYKDLAVSQDVEYRYRLIAVNQLEGNRYSHPLKVTLPISQSGFHGGPQPIPGTIEAEDFDLGGEGTAFHDSDDVNVPGAYRTDVGVDIERRNDGGFHVTDVQLGEWLEYAVSVESAGTYTLSIETTSASGGGYVFVKVGTALTTRLLVPTSGDDQTSSTIQTEIILSPGSQTLKVQVAGLPEFNIDRLRFDKGTITSVEHPSSGPDASVKRMEFYPNPSEGIFTLQVNPLPERAHVEVFDMIGRSVLSLTLAGPMQTLDLSDCPAGLYTIVLTAGAETLATRPFIIQ